MTQPGGRAAITVVGDASKLGAQLERDAQAAIDGVDLDTENISDQIGDAFKEGAREAERALAEIDRSAGTSSKKIITSIDAAGREVKRTFQTMAKDGKVTTTVIEKSFNDAGDEIERSFKFAAADITKSAALIDVVSREAADSAADSWERAGERIERAFAEAKREAIVDQLEVAAAAKAAAGAASNQGSTIQKVFNKVGDSIAGVALSLGSLVAEDLNPAGLAASLISFATTATAVALLAGPILTVAAALVQLGGALALLPAAGFSAALAIGTLVIAFQGFGDAVSAIVAGDPEKIAEALKKLAPEARAVALEFQKLLPAFRELGDFVQQRFFIQLEGDLTRLAKNLLPTFRAGLGNLATELGDIFSQVSGVLSSPQAAKQFQTIFDELATSLDSASTDLARLVNGLLTAAAALAPSFGDIASKVSDIVGDFGDWLAQAAEDGTLQEFLDNAMKTFKSLLSLVGSLGSLFGTLFGGDAADEGRNFIDSITKGIDDLNAALKTPEGQEQLQRIIDSAKALAKVFGVVIDVIGFLIDASSAMEHAFADVVDFLTRSGNDVRRFWDGLVQGVKDAWNAVVGFFSSTGSAISDWWDGLVETVSDAVSSVIGWFQALPGRIMAFLESLPGMVADFFNTAINNVIDIVGTGIGVIIGFFVELPNQLMGAAAALITWVQGLWTSLTDTVVSAWAAIVDFFHSIPDRIAAVWATIVDTATGAFTAIGDWAAGVWAALVDGVSQLPGKIANFFAGIYVAAIDKLTALLNWIKALPGRILSALGDLGSLLFNAGGNIISGLIDGIASKFGRLKEKIAEGAQLIRDHLPFSPAKMGPLSGTGSPEIAGAVIGEMIAAGLDSSLPLISQAASNAASAASPLGAIGQAGVTPLSATPGAAAGQSVLSAVSATAAQQPIVLVQIGDQQVQAVVAQTAREVVQIEVNRLLAGTRGIG